MLLRAEQEPIQSSGLGEGGSFKIHNSIKAFEILSSSLYQDKMLAVIREISCNAADAHKMVGKPLSDIVVHLPTFAEPFFSVRDQGPGLSNDDVLNLYTTYFHSNKDGNNDLIGGFGLGSKAPFSISEQFTVTSWHGCFKRTYICFKDSGVPNIRLVSTETAANGKTGLEVMVATPNASASEWRSKATNYFQWWPVAPSGIGKITPAYNASEIILRSDTFVGNYPTWALLPNASSSTVLMGLVPYTLNLAALTGLDHDVAQAFNSARVLLSFDIGEISISPSRETLSYDKMTITNITKRLVEIQSTFVKRVEAKIATSTSLYEARVAYQELKDSGAEKLAGKLTPKWNGKPVLLKATLSLQYPDPADPTKLAHLSHVRYNKTPYRKIWRKDNLYWHDLINYAHRLDNKSDTIEIYVWAPTITSKLYRTVAHYMETNYPPFQKTHYGHTATHTPEYEVKIISGLTFPEVSKRFEDAGFPPILDASLCPDPPKQVYAGGKASAPKTKGYVFSNGNWNRTEQDIDLTTGGVYAEFFDGNMTGTISEHILSALVRLGWISGAVIGLTKTRLKSAKFVNELTTNKWHKLDASLIQTVPLNLIETSAYHNAYCSIEYNDQNKLIGMRKFANSLTVAEQTKLGLNLLANEPLGNREKCFPSYDWDALTLLLTDQQKQAALVGAKRVKDLVNVVKTFQKLHPLLEYVPLATVDKAVVLAYTNR